MMKNILFIVLGLFVLCNACIEDDSRLPDKPISEITISYDSDSINVDVGAELIYDPEIEQTGNLPLTYEWSYQTVGKNNSKDSLRFLSDERVLKHCFNKLGNYELRLKVSNEHGSTFQRFYLTVRAYDEGIFVLSADENKKGRVSFMRPLSREEQEAGKEETFHTNIFAAINPEYELNDPVDVAKIGSDVFLLSRGDNLVYRIDGQTFELFNITEFNLEFPWMKPMTICSKDRTIKAYYVLSEDGGFVNVDYTSDLAYTCTMSTQKMDKMYGHVGEEWRSGGWQPTAYHFFLNYEESLIYYNYDMYNIYPGPMQSSVYARNEELVNIVMDPNRTRAILISHPKSDSRTVKLQVIDIQTRTIKLDPYKYQNDSYQTDNFTLTRESEMRSNEVYKSVFYTNGNKLYRWMIDSEDIGYYAYGFDITLPETPVVDLGEGKEITCFDFSTDSKQIYLGVYDPSLPDLKGSVYVYDADKLDLATGELRLLKKYEGIADKPIKVFWKNNNK